MNLKRIKLNFSQKGFVVIRKIFDKKKINELLKDLENVKVKAQKTKNNKYFHKTKDGKINTIHNINIFHKKGEVINATKNPKLRSIVEKLIEDKVKLRNIEFFLKPKKTGMESPFHQDNFYWNIKKAKAVNVWIACSKSSKKNGGLCYYESSNKLGTIKHEISFMKGSSQKIPNEVLKNLSFKKKFPVLNIGDCLIHHPEVIHGSFQNKSKYNRVGLVVSFRGLNSTIDIAKLNEYKKNLKKNLSRFY